VQIPKGMMKTILQLNPDYITFFSLENAKQLSEASKQLGRKQKIFLRIANESDYIYKGQEGGFTLKQLEKDIEKIKRLEGIEVGGLTSFPCILIQDHVPTATSNVQSMNKARQILKHFGCHNVQMNMPSATSVKTLPLLKSHGATQGEPGHALTGSTPLHAVQDLAVRPAMTYVSEVLHKYKGNAYVFGGGFYPRSHMQSALVGRNINQLKRAPIIPNDPSCIVYYGALDSEGVNIGDTAIFSFRTQIFVTHAQIAIVKNLSSSPELIGVYDAVGNKVK